MELILTGESQSIERFKEIGFVNYVESSVEDVLTKAWSLAETIASNAPLSVAAGKEAVLRTMDLGCAEGLEEAKRIYEPVYASEDAQEGPRAFAEKRAPVWSGR